MKTPAPSHRSACLLLTLVALSQGCVCGPTCPTTGTGTMSVTVTGLPTGVTGTPVTVTPLSGTGAAYSLGASDSRSMPAGLYEFKAVQVATDDPTVRTVYAPALSNPQECVQSGETRTVTITYNAIPTSNKAWWTNANASGQVLGFASALLQATGSTPATSVMGGAAGNDVAFDPNGNLWAFGPTTADALINRFRADAFVSSGALALDRAIDVVEVTCVPRTAGLAFNDSGDLFFSSPCSHQVFKLPGSRLANSGTAAPAAKLGGATTPTGLAFDSAGNLWVGDPDGDHLLRYDAAHLSTDATAANLAIQVAPAGGGTLPPSFLAFDATGNLWATSFAANVVYRLDASQLQGIGSKTVAPAVSITLGVTALLEGLAFDEGGGLWVAGAAGSVVRLAPSQLTTSSSAGSPTVPSVVVTSSDLGSAGNVAFFPAAPGLPLYHRWHLP